MRCFSTHPFPFERKLNMAGPLTIAQKVSLTFAREKIECESQPRAVNNNWVDGYASRMRERIHSSTWKYSKPSLLSEIIVITKCRHLKVVFMVSRLPIRTGFFYDIFIHIHSYFYNISQMTILFIGVFTWAQPLVMAVLREVKEPFYQSSAHPQTCTHPIESVWV